MLTAIREGSKGWISGIIIGLIVLTFALFGISSYLEGDNQLALATVNGEEISPARYQNELSRQRQALTRRFGSSFDSSLLDSPGFRQQVLDGLIDTQILNQYTTEQNYRLSDEQLVERIQTSESFVTDGQFDPERYQNILTSNGLTPQGYEAIERQNSLGQQLQQAITNSAFTVENELDQLLRLQTQSREAQYAIITADRYVDEFEITDQQAREEYESNKDSYKTEARVKVAYLDLSVEKLASGIQLTEDEIEQTYDRLQGRFKTPEVRTASHILISVDADADESLKAERLRLAESILDQVRQQGDFSDLASSHSDDPGSAVNGGDLGIVTRGQMVKPFEDAVFSMQQGDVRGPVETQFGFHIIKLTELVEGRQEALEEVRSEVEAEAASAAAEAVFTELIEPFQNLIFEQPDSLEPTADETGLSIQTSDWFTQTQGTGVADNPLVRKAAFSEDVLEEGLNSQAIELSFERMVAIRKVEYEAASHKPFEDVREQIVATMKLDRSREKAASEAENLTTGLSHLASWDIMLAQNELKPQKLATERSEVANELYQLGDKVFSDAIPEAGKPVFGLVNLANGDAAIYALTSVSPGDIENPDQAIKQRLTQQATARDGSDLYRQLVKHLRTNAEVVINSEQL